jgi:hypothetical protein
MITLHALKQACRTREFRNLFSEQEKLVFDKWIENQRCSNCWDELLSVFVSNKQKLDEYFQEDTSRLINYKKPRHNSSVNTLICNCYDLEKTLRSAFNQVRVSSAISISRYEDNIFFLMQPMNETSPLADILVINTDSENAQSDMENFNSRCQRLKVFYSAMYKDKITVLCLLFD